MKVKRMSSVSLLPGCPFDSNDFADPEENPDAGGNPSCGFCGSMMSNSAHCRIINCPRVEAIGTFLKAPINLLNGTFACDDVSQEDA
jgi:hypothetical protein